MAKLPRPAAAYLASLTLGAGAAAVALLLEDPVRFESATALGASAFVAAFVVLERTAVSFAWRAHRVTTSLVEVSLFLGYLALPAALLVPLVAASLLVAHAIARRSAVKGIFNVSHGAIAAALGGVALSLTGAAGAPIEVAAVVATVVYSVASESMLAILLGILSRTSPVAVYIERFLRPNAIALAAALPIGVALLALWRLYPPSILAVVPVLVLLQRMVVLEARADRELAVRRRLASESRGLIGSTDEDASARQVLGTALDLLNASRVRLLLADGRAWDEPAGPHAAAGPHPIEASVVGRDGVILGSLAAWERPGKRRFAEEERELLHILAGQIAAAFESARALFEVATQRDIISRQEKLSALGTLLAGVAHEIANPLSFMRIRLAALQAEAPRLAAHPDPAVREAGSRTTNAIEVLDRGITRLDGLTHSLKVVARPGDGARSATDVNEVVDQVMTILRAGHREASYDVALAPTLPPVLANAAELHQVVLNLVKNAGEVVEGRSDGRVRITTGVDDGAVVVTVVDNGPGIPPEAQRRMFTPFFTTKKQGTGLGLSISHQIVARHGGELAFTSEVGTGTTFRVRLPLARAETN